MSWTNDKENNVFDYLYIAEIMDRGIPLGGLAERDEEHGRCRTLLEQALDFAFVNICNTGPLPLARYKDPDDCPEPFLHNLAIEHGVSGWYASDDEAIRRRIIKEGKEIHRRAGTVAGITQALAAINVDAVVVPSKKPYMITLTSSQVLTQADIKAITDRVKHYKSARDSVMIDNETKHTSHRYNASVSVRYTRFSASSKGNIFNE